MVNKERLEDIRNASRGLAAIGCVIGIAVLLGWLFRFGPLIVPLAGHATTKANAALCAVLLGPTIWLLYGSKAVAWRRALASIALTICGLTLLESVLSVDLHIDQIIAPDIGDHTYSIARGRIAPTEALGFLFLASSCILYDLPARAKKVGTLLAVFALILGVLGMLGCLYYAPRAVRTDFISEISLAGAIAVTTLSCARLGIVAHTNQVEILASDNLGGQIARRLIPLAIIFPPIFGWARLQGEIAGWYSFEFGLSALVLVMATTATAMVWWLARTVDRTDKIERLLAEVSNQAELIDLTHDTIMVRELDGTILFWNNGAQEMYGFTAEEAVGQTSHALLKTEFPSPPEELAATVLERGRWEGELVHFSKSGQRIVVASRWAIKKSAKRGTATGAVSELGTGTDPAPTILEINNDITETKQAEIILIKSKEELEIINRELAQARDQAQAASKFKSEFVANMSHEIRTPMNGITGMCNILLKSGLNEQQSRYATAISEAATSLLSIINDILDFSKIEAGRVELEIMEFDPERVIESACELLSITARSKGTSFLCYIDGSIPKRLLGDPERLRQVLINLASNAIKFSNHGEVVVKAELMSSRQSAVNIRFSVIDQGIGLTPEEQAKLFQPFVQADGSISRKFGGTGLGLSISKHLVELMGGTIGVESVKNEGSTFWFSLDFERRSESPLLCIREELKDIRVLIVDDEPYAREILHNYVISWGMRNGCADSAVEGMRMLRQAYVDGDPYMVALVDMAMPEKNGLEFAKDIFADPAIAATKMILITASDTPGLSKLSIQIGFKAFLTKPIRQSPLLECLIGVVRKDGGEPKLSLPGNFHEASQQDQQPLIQNKPVLVAEDHFINQQVAQFYLKELGFSCELVNNGLEAVQAVESGEYALVLMDCQMPEMDGLTATRQIRKAEALSGRKTIIVAVTAHAMAGDRERCLDAGMNDYISKPVDLAQLRRVIETWVGESSIGESSTGADSGAENVAEDEQITELKSRYGVEGLTELVKIFVKQTPKTIDDIRQTASERQADALAKHAHGLKGVSATMLASELREVCQKLEMAGRSQDWLEVDRLIPDLNKEMDSTTRLFLSAVTLAEADL